VASSPYPGPTNHPTTFSPSSQQAALAFEAADAQKLAEGAEGDEAAADEDPLLLDSSDLEDADVKVRYSVDLDWMSMWAAWSIRSS
jgi:hypothetical protein